MKVRGGPTAVERRPNSSSRQMALRLIYEILVEMQELAHRAGVELHCPVSHTLVDPNEIIRKVIARLRGPICKKN